MSLGQRERQESQRPEERPIVYLADDWTVSYFEWSDAVQVVEFVMIGGPAVPDVWKKSRRSRATPDGDPRAFPNHRNFSPFNGCRPVSPPVSSVKWKGACN